MASISFGKGLGMERLVESLKNSQLLDKKTNITFRDSGHSLLIEWEDSDPEEVALTKAQIHIINHSLGFSHGGMGGRNYFCTGEGSSDFRPIEKLVEMGLMVKRDDPISSDFIYHVTEKGKKFVK